MFNSSSPPPVLEWWANSHYAFAAYVLPAVIVISALENAFTLVALLTMRHGIGRITHALFVGLAVADLFDLFTWYGLTIFADYGLRYLTGGAISLSAVNQYDAVCKSLRGVGFFANHCSHWLYVLVNAERVFAVLSPHRAHRWRTKRCLILPIGAVIVSGLLTGAFSAKMYSVKPSPAIGGTQNYGLILHNCVL